MEITREQVLEIYNMSLKELSGYLLKEFPEAFKIELEVGKVYKEKGNFMFMFTGKYGRDNNSEAYGFTTSGKWYENLGVCEEGEYTQATTEEWNAALIEEAKRKGYVGNYIKMIIGGSIGSCSTKQVMLISCLNDKIIGYNSNSSWTLFKDGIWAEIMPTMSQKEAEEKLGVLITMNK